MTLLIAIGLLGACNPLLLNDSRAKIIISNEPKNNGGYKYEGDKTRFFNNILFVCCKLWHEINHAGIRNSSIQRNG